MHKVPGNNKGNVDEIPSECPHCHVAINPIFNNLRFIGKFHEAYFSCPNPDCKKGFFAYYMKVSSKDFYNIEYVQMSSPRKNEFPDSIGIISMDFENIYNQASYAEQYNLNEIAGSGYRKSLEFLIKDYLINFNENDKNKIGEMRLHKCIVDFIKDPRIVEVARRAVWLGNDHTHYMKKWSDKDINDLKGLINLTVNWIDLDYSSRRILENMPDPKQNR